MESWNITEDIKNQVLDLAKELENERVILFVLKNLGPQRFTDLEKYCDVSRSTLSKYLKLHLEKEEIEKKIYDNNGIQEPRYFITQGGVEKLDEDRSYEQNGLLYINELNEWIIKLNDMIQFYEQISVDESIIIQIIRIISKIGDNFFEIEQNTDLYLTIFYMFNNSILTPEYKFEINMFCKQYNELDPSLRIKKFKIDFYVDKIMSSHLGFFMFVRGEDVFFFHKDDILGTTTIRLIKDKLIEEIINKRLDHTEEVESLDEMARDVSKKLLHMNLIWEQIQDSFEMLIQKLILKIGMELGISKAILMDLVVQIELDREYEKIRESMISILQGSTRYEDLNVISISEKIDDQTKEEKIEHILGQIKGRGFCPHCGKLILKHDLSNKCAKCGKIFEPKNLLKSIDEANEVSRHYKEKIKKAEGAYICPNPDCEQEVYPDMDICPSCSHKLKREIRK
ncbi:MAG: hypothetical protein BAJALOKI2v1_730016 [Promethearchaeota archaeon]|nr:MAG: hypothetical protein BAJALOKI2v1_730016 [Candidatus Lokiarchaeota archaeon]